MENSFNKGTNEKREVPGYNSETGLATDYMNEITSKIAYLMGANEDGLGELKKAILIKSQKRLRKYEERYSEDEYLNVINEKNSESIKKLNELADKLNTKFEDLDNLSVEDLVETYKKMGFLINGPEWEPKKIYGK